MTTWEGQRTSRRVDSHRHREQHGRCSPVRDSGDSPSCCGTSLLPLRWRAKSERGSSLPCQSSSGMPRRGSGCTGSGSLGSGRGLAGKGSPCSGSGCGVVMSQSLRVVISQLWGSRVCHRTHPPLAAVPRVGVGPPRLKTITQSWTSRGLRKGREPFKPLVTSETSKAKASVPSRACHHR